jgi:hypothetical protein
VPTEHVVNGRIPEESGGKEYEADDWPQEVVKDTAEPVSEEPENGDDQSRSGESKQSHQAGHGSELLARTAHRSVSVEDQVRVSPILTAVSEPASNTTMIETWAKDRTSEFMLASKKY